MADEQLVTPDMIEEEQLVTLDAIETVLQCELATKAVESFVASCMLLDGVLDSVCTEVGVDFGVRNRNGTGVLAGESDVPITTLASLPPAPGTPGEEPLFALAPIANVSETTPCADQWVKYAQKRVRDGNKPAAVLKQSYKCQRPGCFARMVTEKNTYRNQPVHFVFHGAHNHSITSQLHEKMVNASYCDLAYTGGRLKRMPRPY